MLKEVAHFTHIMCLSSTGAVCFYISQGMLLRDTTCTFLQTDEHRKRQDKMLEGKGLVGMGLGKMEWLQMEMVVVVMTDLQLALPGSTGIVNKDILICQS